MKKSYKFGLAAIAASLVLAGCSDSIAELAGDPGEDYDDGGTELTAQFVDTYVKGLNYACMKESNGELSPAYSTGVTNEKGEFTCKSGDVVEFSLGKYVLGRDHSTENIMTPYDIVFGLGQSAYLDIAQLLQTLDDHTIDGVLTIPDNFTALDNITVKPGDPDFDALIADALPGVTALVDEDVAQAHLDESVPNPNAGYTDPVDLESFVSGKVLTFTNQTEIGMDLVATFNTDYSYSESSDTHTCSGKWSVVSENDIDYVGVTCDEPASTTMPTSPSDSDLVYQFWGPLTDGMSVTLHTSDENDVDVIFDGTITVTDI